MFHGKRNLFAKLFFHGFQFIPILTIQIECHLIMPKFYQMNKLCDHFDVKNISRKIQLQLL